MPIFKTLEGKLTAIIPRILRNNAGGIKYLDLLMQVAASLDEEPVEEEISPFELSDRLEVFLKDFPDYHTLEYEWPMGDDMFRAKQFVYFKREGE